MRTCTRCPRRESCSRIRRSRVPRTRSRSPAKIIESTSAGPANCAAAVPVITKMPAPMIAPTPSVVRLNGPSVRRSVSVCASAVSSSIDFRVKSPMGSRIMGCRTTWRRRALPRVRRSGRARLSEPCQSRTAHGGPAIVRPRARPPDSSEWRRLRISAPSAVRARTRCCSRRCSCARSCWRRLLAYEAHDAARSHRATAERALHDYAAVAAWELVAGVNDELQSSLGGALAPMTRARATSPYELLPAPSVLSVSADNVLRCPRRPSDDSSRFYFRIDFRDGSLATSGAAPSPAMRTWLIDTITTHGRSVYKPDWRYAVVLGGPARRSRVGASRTR